MPFTHNPNIKDGKACTHCGHYETNAQAMNLHIMGHENDNKQMLSEKEWNNHLMQMLLFKVC